MKDIQIFSQDSLKYVKGRKYVVVMDGKGGKAYQKEKRDKDKRPTSIAKIIPWLKERNGIMKGFVRATKEVPDTEPFDDSKDSVEEVDIDYYDDIFL